MIHTYSLYGNDFCMDVESGAIHILEKAAYDLVNFLSPKGEDVSLTETCPQEAFTALSSYKKEEVEEAYAELYELYENDQLFSKRDYTPSFPQEYPIKAVCLHVAHDCNLRCKYCFADGGGYCAERALMPIEVAKKAIDFMIEKSGSRRNLELDFFGGEPLMNLDVVKQTVEYARSIEEKHNKNFRFTLTTNGLLLNDEVIEYLNETMDNVVLSIDGRKDVNDSVRIGVNGKGSYDAIVPKLQKFREVRGDKSYYVRGTFTAENLDFAKDVLHMHDLGFDQVSVEPVVLDPSSPMALKDEHLPQIFAEYEKLGLEIDKINKSDDDFINFFHFMVDLDQGPCVIKRMKGCGSGSEYVAITPAGEVYPCHRFVGNTDFVMGNIMESFDLDKELTAKFTATTIPEKDECDKCWAKYFCSGGCAANNFYANGDILKPNSTGCEMEKKRLECAIAMKAL